MKNTIIKLFNLEADELEDVQFISEGNRAFIFYVEKHSFEDHWSLDACANRALKDGSFSRSQTVCTKTLYNYVDLELLSIKNIDFPEKLRRSLKTARVRENKRRHGGAPGSQIASTMNTGTTSSRL